MAPAWDDASRCKAYARARPTGVFNFEESHSRIQHFLFYTLLQRRCQVLRRHPSHNAGGRSDRGIVRVRALFRDRREAPKADVAIQGHPLLREIDQEARGERESGCVRRRCYIRNPRSTLFIAPIRCGSDWPCACLARGREGDSVPRIPIFPTSRTASGRRRRGRAFRKARVIASIRRAEVP